MCPQIFAKGPDAVKALATNGAQFSSLQGGMQVFSPKLEVFSILWGAICGKKDLDLTKSIHRCFLPAFKNPFKVLAGLGEDFC